MIHIVNGLQDHNEYFIFRDDGKEVKVEIGNGMILSHDILLKEEREFINENILMKESEPVDEEKQSIISLAYKGFTDYYISKKLGISYNIVYPITVDFWKNKMNYNTNKK